MIVVDTNILVYAYSPASPHYSGCRRWLEDTFGSEESVRLPWMVMHAFMRLMSLPHAVSTPQRIETLVERVDEWLAIPNVSPVVPGARYWSILQRLLIEKQIHANLVNDAHIAALAIENGASVCTADRDFRQFNELEIINPLA